MAEGLSQPRHWEVEVCPECGRVLHDASGKPEWRGAALCGRHRPFVAGVRIRVVEDDGSLDRAEVKVRELHRALSEGYGVEDGGIWEDRALAAERRVLRLEEALKFYADETNHQDAAPGRWEPVGEAAAFNEGVPADTPEWEFDNGDVARRALTEEDEG